MNYDHDEDDGDRAVDGGLIWRENPFIEERGKAFSFVAFTLNLQIPTTSTIYTRIHEGNFKIVMSRGLKTLNLT